MSEPMLLHSAPASRFCWRPLLIASLGLALPLAACSSTPESHMAKISGATDSSEAEGGNALIRIANQLAADGRHSAAVPLYRRAIGLTGNTEARLGLGRSLAALGAYQEAARVYEEAYDSDKDNPVALRGLATAYLNLGQPELALPIFEDAIALNFRDVRAQSGKAVALDALGDHLGALAAHRSALDADPDDLQARNNYGLSLALGGDYDDAIDVLRQVVRDDRAEARHRQNLALALGLAGHDKEAAKVASIDMDMTSVKANLIYYAELRGLESQDRIAVVVNGARPPKQDLRKQANLVFGESTPEARAAIDRLTREPEAAAVVLPEKNPRPDIELAAIRDEKPPAPPPDIDMPPLLEPVGYALQVAAYRHAEELMPGWEKIRTAHADLIGDLEPRRSEIDFGPRGSYPSGFFYRLNAGPLTSYAEALSICEQLVERGAECWVRVPEPSEGSLPESSVAEAPAGELDDSWLNTGSTAENASASAARETAEAVLNETDAALDASTLPTDTTTAATAANEVWTHVETVPPPEDAEDGPPPPRPPLPEEALTDDAETSGFGEEVTEDDSVFDDPYDNATEANDIANASEQPH